VNIVYHCDTHAQYKAKPFLVLANARASLAEDRCKRRALGPQRQPVSVHTILGAARVDHFKQKCNHSEDTFSLPLSPDGFLACDFDGARGLVIGLDRKLVTPAGQAYQPLCFKSMAIEDDDGVGCPGDQAWVGICLQISGTMASQCTTAQIL
jgi:hypothetical protein